MHLPHEIWAIAERRLVIRTSDLFMAWDEYLRQEEVIGRAVLLVIDCKALNEEQTSNQKLRDWIIQNAPLLAECLW